MGWNPIKDFKKAVKNVGKAVEKAVNDTGNYLSKDLGKDLVKIGNGVIEGAGIVYEYSVGAPAQLTKWVDDGLLNGNIDLYTGGLVSDWENSFEVVRKVGDGGNVEGTLKSGARVGAVAGATALTGGSITAAATMTMTTAGKASEKEWGQIVGGIATGAGAVAGGIGKTIGDVVNNIFNPKDEIVNAWTNDSGQYVSGLINQDDGNKKVLIVGLIVGVTLLTVAMATTKKRKK